MNCKIKEEPKCDTGYSPGWVLKRVGPCKVEFHLNEILKASQKKKLTVGREGNVDILCSTGATVSQIHCELEFTGDCWLVKDLESFNGTFINGEKITTQTALRMGDSLGIGNRDNYDVNHFLFDVLIDIKKEIPDSTEFVSDVNEIAPTLYSAKIKLEKSDSVKKEENVPLFTDDDKLNSPKSLHVVESSPISKGKNKHEEMVNKETKNPAKNSFPIIKDVTKTTSFRRGPKAGIKKAAIATIEALTTKTCGQTKSIGGEKMSGMKIKCFLTNNQIMEKYARKMNDMKMHPSTECQVSLTQVTLSEINNRSSTRQPIVKSSSKNKAIKETEKRFHLLRVDSDFGRKVDQQSKSGKSKLGKVNKNGSTDRCLERQASSVYSVKTSIAKTQRINKSDELPTQNSGEREGTSHKVKKPPSVTPAPFKIPKRKSDQNSTDSDRAPNYDSKKKSLPTSDENSNVHRQSEEEARQKRKNFHKSTPYSSYSNSYTRKLELGQSRQNNASSSNSNENMKSTSRGDQNGEKSAQSSSRQQLMDDPFFLVDLDKTHFSKEKKEKVPAVPLIVKPAAQPTPKPARGILKKGGFRNSPAHSRNVTFSWELNKYLEIPSREDDQYKEEMVNLTTAVLSQNAEVPSVIKETTPSKITAYQTHSQNHLHSFLPSVETISQFKSSRILHPDLSTSPKTVAHETTSSHNHNFSGLVETIPQIKNASTSPILFYENPHLGRTVQKVIPEITIQDFGGIAEENHQRSLLTVAILSIIAELKMRILFWNFDWIAEQRSQVGTMPPILESVREKKELFKLDVQPSLTDYTGLESYFRSFRSFMVQEIWSIICHAEAVNEHAINWQVFVLSQNPTEEGFVLLDCQSVFQSQPRTTELDVGTLVVVMPLQLSPKIFGIVEKLQWKPMPLDMRKEEQFLAIFQLRVRTSLNPNLLKTGQPVSVSKITSLCPIINQLSMITELDNSSLKNIILQPSKHEEAFQLASSINHQCSAAQSISQTILRSDPKVPKVLLLQGPPGTGKTKEIMEIVRELVFQHYSQFGSNPRLLICAPSDSAVDEIVARLLLLYPQSQDDVKILRIGGKHGPSGRAGKVREDDTTNVELDRKADEIWKSNVFKLKSEYMENISSYENELQLHSEAEQRKQTELSFARESGDAIKISSSLETLRDLENRMNVIKLKLEQLKDDHIEYCQREKKPQIIDIHRLKEKIICEADIICTTLKSCRTREMNRIFFPKQSSIQGCNRPFLCAVYDDASKCSELESLSPLGLGINKLIMIGDVLQPPQSQVFFNPELATRNHSMFNRFCSYFMNLADSAKNSVISLNTQYRMDPAICQWPSEYFYSSNRLLTSLKLNRFGPCHAYSVLNVTGGKENCYVDCKGGQSICNENEAEVVATIIKVLVTLPTLRNKSIGIITFYQKQRRLIEEKMIAKCGRREVKNVCVDTVDFYHGKEKDIVIVSCVRANRGEIGLVSSPLLINTSLTRAKESLIVCGHSQTLKVSEAWSNLYENAMMRGRHFDTSTCSEHVLQCILLRTD